MRKIRAFLAVSSVLLAASVAAQEAPGNVAQVFFVKPKAGLRQQFEQGGKRHMEWHRQQKDTWTWPVWEVIAGDRTGEYVAATLNHTWKEFDDKAQFIQADVADYHTNIAPHVESAVTRFYLLLPDLSRPLGMDAPSRFTEVVEFHLKPESEREFLRVNRRIQEGIQKTNWPVHYLWYELWTGGDHSTYVLLLPRQNWSQFAPPELSFPAMLEKAFGREEAESLLTAQNKTIRSLRSEVLMYRPDLSYVPAAN